MTTQTVSGTGALRLAAIFLVGEEGGCEGESEGKEWGGGGRRGEGGRDEGGREGGIEG